MPDLVYERLLEWPNASPYVYSVMLFPHDLGRQQACFQSILASVVAKDFASSDTGLVPRGLANFVFQAPRTSDLFSDRQLNVFASSIDFCCLAFGLVLRSAPVLPELASMTTALKWAVRSGRGSIATSKRAWATYGSVAHFWLAVLDFDQKPWAPHLGPVAFLHFLSVAEKLRHMGEAWVPKHARKPVLDPSWTWKVPSGFKLPSVGVEFPLLTREAAESWLAYLG